MDIIKRNTKLGVLYVNKKNLKMVLEYEDEIISDQTSILKIFEENRVPIKAQFEITEKCNFSCYYCYAKSLRSQKDLTTEEVKLVIDKLYDIGIVFLELTGGEILLRKDFLKILKYLNERGFLLSLFTNISLIDRKIINEMKNVYMINTSLLAPTEEKCDELTGKKGSFNSIVNGIALLKESKIPFYVQATLTNENIDLYTKFKEFEDRLNINLVYNIDVGPTFEGFNKVEEYSLKNEHVSILKEILDKQYVYNMKTFIKEFKCGIGTAKFVIDSEGNILPCMKYRVKLGNILKNQFEDIWNSKALINIMNSKLKRSEECGNCEKREYCLNCPGITKLYNNNSQKCRKADILFSINRKAL